MGLDILEYAVLAAAVVIAVPLAVLTSQCLAAHLPSRRDQRSVVKTTARIDVLVPAHDEADGIAATIASITPQLAAGDRLWVVADNCQDATAEVARRAGATVLERHSEDERGKGFALEFGVRHLLSDPPEILVLIDADCLLESGAIAALAGRVVETGQPVQAVYLMRAPAGAGPQALVSEYAVTVKNLVRPLGLARLGMPCLLTGSGIALPWQIAREVKFCGNSIVEDMQLSIDLLKDGHHTVFEPAAKLVAPLPLRRDVAARQRRRWEHGHLQLICKQVPRLLWAAARQLRWDLLVVASDIMVPPLSLLGAAWGTTLLLALALAFMTGSWIPSAVLLGVGSVAGGAVATALWRFSPTRVSRRDLLTVPVYVLRKLSMYASFPVARQTKWNRTARDLPIGSRLDESSGPVRLGGLHSAGNSDSAATASGVLASGPSSQRGEKISAGS